ncbi:MAG: TRAP transporter small permease [Pseudomonadota bacterium]
MSVLGRGVRSLSTKMNYIAGFCMVGMMTLTCADVVLRLFRRPILGTYEIVEFLGATIAAFAMALTTLHRGHVAVEVLVMTFSRGIQRLIFLLTQLAAMGLFLLLGFECIRYGNDLRTSGEVSLTLELPFYPVLYGMAFSALIVFVVLCFDFWGVMAKKVAPYDDWKD